jgi:sarcosine oxidase
LQALCTVQRQVIGWFEVQDPAHFIPEAFPVFVLQDKLGYYYGFPTFDHPGMKIGKFYHLFEETQPDDLSREITAADEEVGCIPS